MQFYSKRKLLDSMERDRWRKFERVLSTASMNKFQGTEPSCSGVVKTTLASRRVTEMGAEEVTSHTLSEELVEKIIAMMPYPSIFKARLLSKAWFARFKPISFLDTEEEKSVAKSFQKMVAEWSCNWDTFCAPVCTTVKDPIVYNQATLKWQILPPLSFLQYNMFPTGFPTRLRLPQTFSWYKHYQHYEGAFLYGAAWFEEEHLYVGNILTREWKLLPVRPEENHTGILCMKLVIDTVLGTYKLILLCETDPDVEDYKCYAQMYDSKSETWRSMVYISDNGLFYIPDSAFLDGVLYMVLFYDWHCLLAFNVEKWTLEELRLSFPDAKTIDSPKLVICNGNLLMIVIDSKIDTVSVLKVDLVSLQLLEVARSPPTFKLDVIYTRDMIKSCVGDTDCLLFKLPYSSCRSGSRLVKYKKHEDEWSFFSVLQDGYQWSDCNFQPGLNPFMAV